MPSTLSLPRTATWVVLILASRSAEGQVAVRFEPADLTVDLGAVFNVHLYADIPDPIVGWGLDLNVDQPAFLTQVGSPAIGPLWFPAPAPDGDGLAGLAFPVSISGDDLLLATITFSAGLIGETDLFLDVTPGDLTEGFALDPSGFASTTFGIGHVTVVPEPAGLPVTILAVLCGTSKRRRTA